MRVVDTEMKSEVCYSLLARGVSTRDMESIIRTVLKKLGNVNIGKLPKKECCE